MMTGCRTEYEVILPYQFVNTPGSGRFSAAIRRAMEGVYTVSDGSDQFGPQVALKWTYLREGADTTHYLSILTGTDATYFNLEGDPNADSLRLNGYWRKLVSTATGRVTLRVGRKRNGNWQPFVGQPAASDTLVVEGVFGEGNAVPAQKLTLTYRRPLNPKPFAILAHRGGGRTSELLPASENTVEIIKLASRLGATGIEVDIRYTKDGVPILYHDNTLNQRLVQKNGLTGPVEAYTYQQLTTLVRLVNGEKIPTLEQALETVVNNTHLNFVWLDTKYISSMDKVQAIQQLYQQKARLTRRDLRIFIGLPSAEAVERYQALPDKANTPILCELDTATTRRLGARIWGPRWTLGPQTQAVSAMQADGFSVFVWTLDELKFIEAFVRQNKFNGILSNYSTVVAYYHYTDE